MKHIVRIFIIILLASLSLNNQNKASQNITHLTVNIPPIIEQIWGERLFDNFEAEHPGVKIVLVELSINSFRGSPVYDFEQYLETSENYVSSADVLFVSSFGFYPEATHAGHYLDLSPLIASDSTFTRDDFYPAILSSFEWDGGTWALPGGADFWSLNYAPKAFDEANLNYPNADWTLDDFAAAVRILTQRDANDQAQIPGFFAPALNDFMLLFPSLTRQGFYDSSVIPNAPTFTRPELIETLEVIAELNREGSLQYINSINTSGWETQVPMRIGPLSSASGTGTTFGRTDVAPLPGGGAGIFAYGYAVSGGTAYPELAYDLVKYLTTDPIIASVYMGESPAFRFTEDSETLDLDTNILHNLTPKAESLVAEAREQGLNLSQLRYVDYVIAAYLRAREDNIDIEIALEDAEILARNNLQLAIESRESSTIVVSPPNLPPELATNEVALNFGVMSFVSPLPNHDHWQQFLTEFAERDPQVGHISLDSRMIGERPEEWDCFFVPGNMTTTPDSVNLLDLTPLTVADPDFQTQDFIGAALQAYQDSQRTLGLPMALYPVGLWYNEQTILENNLPLPIYGWTTQDLEIILNTVSPRPALELRPNSISDLLALIAVYGGLPFDFRTTPPTLDFLSDKTVSAIEQVLDLIKSGLVGQASWVISAETNLENPVLFTGVLDNRSTEFLLMQHGNMDATPYRLTTLPASMDYAPMIFSVGGGYITASSPHPEACYRLLTQLALRPDLYQAMPARYSVLNTSQIPVSDQIIDYYRFLADLAQLPETIVITNTSHDDEFNLFQDALARTLSGDSELHTALSEAEQTIITQR